ncbi:unnamed protein product, partial [Bubo scandiacus]
LDTVLQKKVPPSATSHPTLPLCVRKACHEKASANNRYLLPLCLTLLRSLLWFQR